MSAMPDSRVSRKETSSDAAVRAPKNPLSAPFSPRKKVPEGRMREAAISLHSSIASKSAAAAASMCLTPARTKPIDVLAADIHATSARHLVHVP